jgi:hypothetical protein
MGKAASGLLEQDDPAQPAKKAADRKTLGQENQVAPRAGRTGGAGARAERPSEGSNRKTAAIPQVGRGGKAPSASAAGKRGAKAGSGQASGDTQDQDLPQAARDSTA